MMGVCQEVLVIECDRIFGDIQGFLVLIVLCLLLQMLICVVDVDDDKYRFLDG